MSILARWWGISVVPVAILLFGAILQVACAPVKPRKTPLDLLTKLNLAADEITAELRASLQDRGRAKPPEVSVMAGSVFGMLREQKKLDTELFASTENFLFWVQYVYEDEFEVMQEIMARVIQKHGIERMAVRPLMNYMMIQGKRVEVPAWTVLDHGKGFVVGSDGEVQRAPIELSALFHEFGGTAVLPDTRLEDGSHLAFNPVYGYKGMQVMVPGEDIQSPLSSFKGGRGELTFAIHIGKPITSRSVGELYVEDGKLIFNERLSIVFRRGPRIVFLVRRVEESGIQEFGVGFYGGIWEASKNSVRLVLEGQRIKGEEFQFFDPAGCQGFDVMGQPVELEGRELRAMWFAFDEAGRLSRVPD